MNTSLSRVIESHLYNLSAYQKEIQKDIKLGYMERSIYLQYVRLRELQRITEAIEEAFNELGDESKPFLQALFLEGRQPTIQAAAEQTYMSLRTAKRVKKKFIQDIAIRLGWI